MADNATQPALSPPSVETSPCTDSASESLRGEPSASGGVLAVSGDTVLLALAYELGDIEHFGYIDADGLRGIINVFRANWASLAGAAQTEDQVAAGVLGILALADVGFDNIYTDDDAAAISEAAADLVFSWGAK